LADESGRQLQETRKELSEQLNKLGAELSDRLLAAQEEARQRDNDLRQELLALSAWLDDKKTSRQDLSRMFFKMGQQLQGEVQAPAEDLENE
jgi:hypothetical protein